MKIPRLFFLFRADTHILLNIIWWCFIFLWSFIKPPWTIFNKITIVNFQRGITPKMYRKELWFWGTAYCLMILYISVKFHENTLTVFKLLRADMKWPLSIFQVIERTWFCDINRQTTKLKTISLPFQLGETELDQNISSNTESVKFDRFTKTLIPMVKIA